LNIKSKIRGLFIKIILIILLYNIKIKWYNKNDVVKTFLLKKVVIKNLREEKR